MCKALESETNSQGSSVSPVVEGKPKGNPYTYEEQGTVFRYLWHNIIILLVIGQSLYLYSFYVVFSQGLWNTWLCSYVLLIFGGLGGTAGIHRLWSHRAFEARLPFRILLMIQCTMGGITSIWNWCVIHRVHHRYSDTNDDPCNADRGVFFSHIGWVVTDYMPQVKRRMKECDMSDLEKDPVVVFNRKYYPLLYLLITVAIPTAIPMYFWDETFWNAFLISYVQRQINSLHGLFLVNSAAHLFGGRPYESKSFPRQNPWVSWIALGEGSHNYHHAYPWDYRTSEETFSFLNWSTMYIDLMAFLGQVPRRKTVASDIVEKRKTKMANLASETAKQLLATS